MHPTDGVCVFRAAGGPTPARGPRPLASAPVVSRRRRSQGGGEHRVHHLAMQKSMILTSMTCF